MIWSDKMQRLVETNLHNGMESVVKRSKLESEHLLDLIVVTTILFGQSGLLLKRGNRVVRVESLQPLCPLKIAVLIGASTDKSVSGGAGVLHSEHMSCCYIANIDKSVRGARNSGL
jgi:hypothetical protein